MAWKSSRGKWNWRSRLTEDEEKFIKTAEAELDKIENAMSSWQEKYGLKRRRIVNRAIQRAKFESRP